MGGETQLETSYWQLTEKMNKTLNRFLKQHQDTDDIDDCTSSILHAFIAKILCSKTLLKTYPRQPIAPDEIGTLSSEEQADLHDTATHIATRIKELILQQDICLKSFQYIRESDDTKCIIEYDEPEPETKDKIQNLLDNNELRDLWTLLTNLQPYVLHAPPNPHFQTNESSLILSILISLDIFEDMTKDQPQETQTTRHAPELAEFLQRHHQQQTA